MWITTFRPQVKKLSITHLYVFLSYFIPVCLTLYTLNFKLHITNTKHNLTATQTSLPHITQSTQSFYNTYSSVNQNWITLRLRLVSPLKHIFTLDPNHTTIIIHAHLTIDIQNTNIITYSNKNRLHPLGFVRSVGIVLPGNLSTPYLNNSLYLRVLSYAPLIIVTALFNFTGKIQLPKRINH